MTKNFLSAILFLLICFSLFAENKTNEKTSNMGTSKSDKIEKSIIKKNQKLNLNDCLVYALKHSPTLQRLDLNLKNQKLQTMIQKAVFDTTLATSSTRDVAAETDTHSISAIKELPGGFDLSTSVVNTRDRGASSNNGNYSVTLTKRLLGRDSTFLETLDGVKDSLIDELVSSNNIRREKRSIIFNIKDIYYRLIRDVQSLGIRKRRFERTKQNLKHAKLRGNPLDIATSEIEVPDAELDVIRAERSIQDRVDQLKVFMGYPMRKKLEVDDSFEFYSLKQNPLKDIEYAQKNHEDFLNNKLVEKKLIREAKIAGVNLFPDVALSGTHRQASQNGAQNFRGLENQVIRLTVSWELGKRADKARKARALYNIKDQHISYFILTQNKGRRLFNLSRRLTETAKSIELQNNKVKHSQRQVDIYQDLWENGETNILEFVRSQNTLENAKVDLINFKTAYMALLAEYLFEVGK